MEPCLQVLDPAEMTIASVLFTQIVHVEVLVRMVRLRFDVSCLRGPVTGWDGTYFGFTAFSGSDKPAEVRDSASLWA
eukprot:4419826-Amphidinium_carterae.1